jgi:hypothetical protein
LNKLRLRDRYAINEAVLRFIRAHSSLHHVDVWIPRGRRDLGPVHILCLLSCLIREVQKKDENEEDEYEDNTKKKNKTILAFFLFIFYANDVDIFRDDRGGNSDDYINHYKSFTVVLRC